MSDIVKFFEGGKDNRGRLYDEILAYSDGGLEASHDIVQWLFPLHEKSLHSVNTPVLTPEDIDALRASMVAKDRILSALARFRDFLGIADGLRGPNSKKQAFWCNDGNHNLLRVTRIIRSLRLFGLDDQAGRFYNEVLDIAHQRKINKITRQFWQKAMEEDVGESLTHDFLKIRRIEVS